jgi:hypothetical protein
MSTTSEEEKERKTELFSDELGENVLRAMEAVDGKFNELKHNLKNQFDESEGESLLEKSIESSDILLAEKINDLSDCHEDAEKSSLIASDSVTDLGIKEEINKVQIPSFLLSQYSEPLTSTDADETTFPTKYTESFSNKLFSLIQSLQQREDDCNDEWETDEDCGYVTITLTEQEFYDFEDVSLFTFKITFKIRF